MIVHWAHVTRDGSIVTWGSSVASDVFLQPLAEGLTAVSRPEHVNGWDDWRLVGDQWEKQEE